MNFIYLCSNKPCIILCPIIPILNSGDVTTEFQTRQTVRAEQLKTFGVRLLDKTNFPYEGPINVTLETAAGSNVVTVNRIVTGNAQIMLSYSLKQTGSTNLKLTASNGFFNYTSSLKVTVVGTQVHAEIAIIII